MSTDLEALYPVRRPFPTRWADNDAYGHVNNVVYYAAMDTVINSWLIEEAGVSTGDDSMRFCAVSSCEYHASISFPDTLVVGVGIERFGSSSVTWRTVIFRESDGELIADGRFVHVFVSPSDHRPQAIDQRLRHKLEETFPVTVAASSN